MKFTRRETFAVAAGLAAFGVAGLRATEASATEEEAMKAVMEFAGGEPQAGRISLTAPEIAENGNTVPVTVSVESPMTDADHVQSVVLYADGNPNPFVITFNFTPMSGEATATTRIRLAKTQNVIAVARMKDGSVYMDKKEVKVTIGGCGG